MPLIYCVKQSFCELPVASELVLADIEAVATAFNVDVEDEKAAWLLGKHLAAGSRNEVQRAAGLRTLSKGDMHMACEDDFCPRIQQALRHALTVVQALRDPARNRPGRVRERMVNRDDANGIRLAIRLQPLA